MAVATHSALSLPSNNIVGSLPNSVSLMAGLTRLNLTANTLTGSLPDGVGALVLLQYVHTPTSGGESGFRTGNVWD